MDKEKRNAYMRNYRATHKEKVKEISHKSYMKHQQERLEYRHQYGINQKYKRMAAVLDECKAYVIRSLKYECQLDWNAQQVIDHAEECFNRFIEGQ